MLIMPTHLHRGQPTNANRKKAKSLIYVGLVKANKIGICQVFRFISRADCSAAVGEETKQEDSPPVQVVQRDRGINVECGTWLI